MEHREGRGVQLLWSDGETSMAARGMQWPQRGTEGHPGGTGLS